MTALRLTTGDVERLRAAEQALLSPLDQEDATEWQLRANHAVRRFLGADHSAFSLPTDTVPGVVTDDTDPTFSSRLHSYCIGVFGGEYRFRDPFVQKAVVVRRAGGTGAYHQRMFCCHEELQRSPAYHELFRPTGLTHMIGLSTPMPVGEATQFFSLEGARGEEWSEQGMERLRLLVPAFEAGVRVHRRLAVQRAALVSMLDRLGTALAVYSTDGRSLYRSRFLQELLASEPEAATLRRAAENMARAFAQRWNSGQNTAERSAASGVSQRVRTRGAEYRVLGSYVPEDLFGTEGLLVLTERLRPILPPTSRLQTRFGLTSREAEIALLLAEGLTDAAVAERLVISPHTARRHSERVLGKLKVRSRAAIALALLREDNES